MLKKGCYLVIFVILSAIVIAQNDTMLFPSFESVDEEQISPPVLPSKAVEMQESSEKVKIILKEMGSKEDLKEVHVNLETLNKYTKQRLNTIKYVSEGVLELDIGKGEWQIILKADNLDTLGKDHYINTDFVYEGGDLEKEIYLLPAGSVRGIVYDKDGKVVGNSDLKFECSADYGDISDEKTDSFGSFVKDWLPLGSCKVSAAASGLVGFKEIEVKKGELQDISIVLDKRLVSSYRLYFEIIIGGLLLLIIFYLLKTKDKAKRKKKVQESYVSGRMQDIMKTLNARERDIIDYLIKNKEATMAQVYHATLIPKTSLCRSIDSLERKKIIYIESLGKMKKLHLTPWFLSNA